MRGCGLLLLVACSSGGVEVPNDDGGGALADGSRDSGLALDAPITDAYSWPSCETTPATAKVSTLEKVWMDNPAMPVETWISGAYVTAVSYGACNAGKPCTVFVQDALSYASWSAAARHGLKVFVSAATAQYFTGIKVGDKVDLLAHAWRYNLGGQNELLLQVNSSLPGCFKKTGAGVATPVSATLADFTVPAYEQTHGPVLVQVDGVSGTPKDPDETFGLFKTGTFNDAGISTVTSLSPFFLPNGVFTGLTQGQKYNFTSVIGVFGLFTPSEDAGMAPKYEQIYPRSPADIKL